MHKYNQNFLKNLTAGTSFVWMSVLILTGDASFFSSDGLLMMAVCTLGAAPLAIAALLAWFGSHLMLMFRYVLRASRDQNGTLVVKQTWLNVPLGFALVTAMYYLLFSSYAYIGSTVMYLVRFVYLLVVGGFIGTALRLRLSGYTTSDSVRPSAIMTAAQNEHAAIQQYVADARAAGMSDETIKSTLLGAGWSKEQLLKVGI